MALNQFEKGNEEEKVNFYPGKLSLVQNEAVFKH